MRLLLVFLTVVLPAQVLACERPLRVFAADWPPYTRVQASPSDPSPLVEGIDARILTAVMRHAQCPFQWVVMPVERATVELRRGNIDVMLAASRIPERESYAWFSAPYRDEVIEVVGLLDAAVAPGWDSLVAGERRIMAPRAGWYGPEYARVRPLLIGAGNLRFMDSYRTGVAMLKTHRVDLVMGDRHALRDAAMEIGVVLSYPVVAPYRDPVHFMYSRRSVQRDVVQRVDASIRTLREQGILERLLVDALP